MKQMDSPAFVVLITGKKKDGCAFHGTGFAVSAEGHVATCRHVVADHDEDGLLVHMPYTKPRPYSVRCESLRDDLAIIEGLVPASPPMPFAQLCMARLGTLTDSSVLAFGFAAKEHYAAPQRIECTITAFSSEHGRIGLNGDTNSGDSGGPVLSNENTVLGIVWAKDTSRSGQAMAIPVQRLIELLGKCDLADLCPAKSASHGDGSNVLISGLEQHDMRILAQSLLSEVAKSVETRKTFQAQLSTGQVVAHVNEAAIAVRGLIRSLNNVLELIDAHESKIDYFRQMAQGPLAGGIDYGRHIRQQEEELEKSTQELSNRLESLVASVVRA